MRIAVLGAGLLGVTSAYYLSRDGHDVVVLDRQAEPAAETSHATASLLTPGHTIAWGQPSAPWQLLSSLWDANSALKFQPPPSRQLAYWSLRFLKECTSARYRANTLLKHRLAKYSVDLIGETAREHGISWDNTRNGVLYLERDRDSLQKSRRGLAVIAEAGIEIETIDRDQVLALEPALKHSKLPLSGALRIGIDQVGDGRKFAIGLADVCRSKGVEFRLGETIQDFAVAHDRIAAIITDKGRVEGDAFVMSLGSYSPLWAERLGFQMPIYPVKGYSVTLPVLDPERAPVGGAVEEGSHVTFARLGDRVRMTTRAEFAGYDSTYRDSDFAKILRVGREMFEGGVDFDRAYLWACLRPISPDGRPTIGSSPIANLWLNTGHGYLGWTMSCGSAKLLSDLIAGRRPDIDPEPYRFGRF